MKKPEDKKEIILASSSPRRIALLENFIPAFRKMNVNIIEKAGEAEAPDSFVKRISREKAAAAAHKTGKGIIIAADTVVVIDGKILGKPNSPGKAAEMLKNLSGKTHKVLTGITVLDGETGAAETRCVVTEVSMDGISEEEISFYLKSGEPFDKAGGYGIQGIASLFIKSIKGDYFNVVGLPLSELKKMLEIFGVNLIKTASLKNKKENQW